MKQEGAQLSWLKTTRPTEQVFSLDDEGTELTIALRTYGNSNYTTWHLPLFLTARWGRRAGSMTIAFRWRAGGSMRQCRPSRSILL